MKNKLLTIHIRQHQISIYEEDKKSIYICEISKECSEVAELMLAYYSKHYKQRWSCQKHLMATLIELKYELHIPEEEKEDAEYVEYFEEMEYVGMYENLDEEE